MREVPVSRRICFFLPPHYEMIVWGYFKLFIANLLLVGLCFAWAQMFQDRWSSAILVSTSITTIAAIIDFILSALFIFGCNKKNVRVMKTFYFYSQFLLGLVAALSVYELVGIVIFLNQETVYWLPIEMWVYQAVNTLILFAAFAVDAHIFMLVRAQVIKHSTGRQFKFEHKDAETECLIKIEGSGDEVKVTVENYVDEKKEKEKEFEKENDPAIET